jgi:hypothetical protein
LTPTTLPPVSFLISTVPLSFSTEWSQPQPNGLNLKYVIGGERFELPVIDFFDRCNRFPRRGG